MQHWLVKLQNGTYSMIGSSKTPRRSDYVKAVKLPPQLKSEHERWLQIESVEIGPGVFEDQVTVNATEKQIQQDLDSQLEIAAANAQAHEDKLAKKLARLDFGRRLRAELALLIESKQLTSVQSKAILRSHKLIELERYLLNGSFENFIDDLQSVNLSGLFKASEINKLIGLAQEYIDNE